MINVYVISGFLGSGKTTFIQHLLKNKHFTKVMLLENEFGEVGVDGAFFDKTLNIKEINNGCICCSLQGDFSNALEEIEDMGVSDLIIEPSGIGKLSDILDVIKKDNDFVIVSHICVVDVKTAKKYHINFKEYFDDQVKFANAIIFSHLDVSDEKQVDEVKKIIKGINDKALFNDKPINEYSINELLDLIASNAAIDNLEFYDEHHNHSCCCGHHHGENEECGHHHHHHEGGECECGNHHDHDDEVFKNIILRPDHLFTFNELETILSNVDPNIIRIKGYVNSSNGSLFFNYVLNEFNIFEKEKMDNSLVCIIGTDIDKDKYKNAFFA